MTKTSVAKARAPAIPKSRFLTHLDLTCYTEYGVRVGHVIGPVKEVAAIVEMCTSFFADATNIRYQDLLDGRATAIISIKMGTFTSIEVIAEYHRQRTDAMMVRLENLTQQIDALEVESKEQSSGGEFVSKKLV